ncbi:unnamed protein product [Camellia sinensis]
MASLCLFSSMGSSESTLSSSQITTVSLRSEVVDPLLEKLRSLKICNSNTDSTTGQGMDKIRSAASSPEPCLEEVENKIEVADALTVKLLQRFNYSLSTMKTTSHHLSEVHALQVDLGELKGRWTEAISNCDSLCKRINAEGPESLRSSVKPFSVTSADVETSCRSHGKSVK